MTGSEQVVVKLTTFESELSSLASQLDEKGRETVYGLTTPFSSFLGAATRHV